MKQPLAMQPRIMRLLFGKADMRVAISGPATRVGCGAAGAGLAMTSRVAETLLEGGEMP